MFSVLIQNFITLCIPGVLKNILLNIGRHKVSRDAKIGKIIIGRDVSLDVGKGAKIGSFNCFFCHRVVLKENTFIRRLNTFDGLFDLELQEGASIGNLNRVVNGGKGAVVEKSLLTLGAFSNITSRHFFDLTGNIQIGGNTVIGGISSQFWTHGFQHFNKGSVRCRIDGSLVLGDGVYVASQVVFNPGVSVCDSASIGAGAIVSKALQVPGLYVSQELRCVDMLGEREFRDRFACVFLADSTVKVYKKD